MQILFRTLLLSLLFITVNGAVAQVDSTETDTEDFYKPDDTYNKTYIITTFDGTEHMGAIVSKDDKEIVLETKEFGRMSIPKYQVKEMREVKQEELSKDGELKKEQLFSTRYFLTANALPLKKGENYLLINLYGPDFQFAVTDRLSVGLMTTWLAIPVIGTVKYSFEINEKTHLGLGGLVGTGSWAAPDFLLALPYAVLTLGDRTDNLTFSAGYGAIWFDGNTGDNAIFSVAGMTKVGKNISLVFDSFIIPDFKGTNTVSTTMIIIPGLRIQSKNDRAFQFGFAGVYADGQLLPLPLPMVQWFRKF